MQPGIERRFIEHHPCRRSVSYNKPPQKQQFFCKRRGLTWKNRRKTAKIREKTVEIVQKCNIYWKLNNIITDRTPSFRFFSVVLRGLGTANPGLGTVRCAKPRINAEEDHGNTSSGGMTNAKAAPGRWLFQAGSPYCGKPRRLSGESRPLPQSAARK